MGTDDFDILTTMDTKLAKTLRNLLDRVAFAQVYGFDFPGCGRHSAQPPNRTAVFGHPSNLLTIKALRGIKVIKLIHQLKAVCCPSQTSRLTSPI